VLTFVAVLLAYVVVRSRVQEGLGFMPFATFRFLHLSNANRIGTMLNEIPRIARLLIFPAHLSGDYSPQDVLIANGADVSQLPGVVILVGVVLLAVALRRRVPVASFGLWWLIVAFLPVSNLLVPAGFITAERTLFLPSVGVLLVAGTLVQYVRMRARRWEMRIGAAALVVLVALGLGRSIDRQRVWKNNTVFADQLVKDSPNGYRAHFIRGRALGLEQNKLTEAMREYRRALQLFPYDVTMTLTIADSYVRAGMFEPAAELFRLSYAVAPEEAAGRYEYIYSLSRLARWPEVRVEALKALPFVSGSDARALRQAIAYSDSIGGRGRFRAGNGR